MSGFRATGKGYHNSAPNFAATADDASAVMTSAKGRRAYLFVTNISSSWTLTGSASQTQSRRTFYPQYLVQNDVVIKGQCANQHEYDKLVEFIEQHHYEMLDLTEGGGNIFGTRITSAGFGSAAPARVGVEFMLLPTALEGRWMDPPTDGNNDFITDRVEHNAPPTHGQGKGIYQMPLVHVTGVITEIRAGHTRFVDAPEFEFALRVTNDHRGNVYHDRREVAKAMGGYEASLGKAYRPEAVDTDNNEQSYLDRLEHAIEGAASIGESIWDAGADLLGGLFGGNESDS